MFGGLLAGGGGRSYAWAFDYQEGLGRYAAAGFAWYNEGHIPNHHRDGQAVQLWGRLPLRENRFVISAGVARTGISTRSPRRKAAAIRTRTAGAC